MAMTHPQVVAEAKRRRRRKRRSKATQLLHRLLLPLPPPSLRKRPTPRSRASRFLTFPCAFGIWPPHCVAFAVIERNFQDLLFCMSGKACCQGAVFVSVQEEEAFTKVCCPRSCSQRSRQEEKVEEQEQGELQSGTSLNCAQKQGLQFWGNHLL